MDLYRQPFKNEELASSTNSTATLNLARTYIAEKHMYNFVQASSEKELLDVHADIIYPSNRSYTEKVKKTESICFCLRMANFACLVQDSFAFVLFYTPLKVANPPPLTKEFILKYIEYHRLSLDHELTYNGRICTNDGVAIKCVGTWKSPENLEAFRRMHNNYSKCHRHLDILKYNKACSICVENLSQDINEPCHTCKAMRFVYPNVTSIGNIFKDPLFASKINGFIREMREAFQRRTCIGLQPLEV